MSWCTNLVLLGLELYVIPDLTNDVRPVYWGGAALLWFARGPGHVSLSPMHPTQPIDNLCSVWADTRA
ncbi:hypothetical protein NQZ79_g7301 [Umbelopsis isabellina]|nr:hypothetical protein NQZ79_g7301 [Umbelopsis isabellina]